MTVPLRALAALLLITLGAAISSSAYAQGPE